MPTIISVEHLSKQYFLGGGKRHNSFRDLFSEKISSLFGESQQRQSAAFWALNDISFDVQEGEVLGIIGRNGAGKSTVLKILSRITEPTNGKVILRGRVASLLEVGTGFSGELSGRENIFLNGAILGMKKAEIKKKFDEIIAFAEIGRFIDTPVKRYSSGMYMRLAFAVAAHLEPEILVVDEVLAVGDAQFQQKCLGKMKEIGSNGRTVLFVSHNMAAINSLCRSGIVLHEGRLRFHGSAGDAVNEYMRLQELNVGEKKWEASSPTAGTDGVHIRSVRILSDGVVTATVAINADFFIEIEFENEKENEYLSTNIQLFTTGGVGVLSTANWGSATLNSDEWSGRKYPKGVFRATCKVPGFFLNEGNYTINLLVMSNVSHAVVRMDNAISFTVLDTGDMRKEYTDGWLGVVRPKLEWKTEFRGDTHIRE